VKPNYSPSAYHRLFRFLMRPVFRCIFHLLSHVTILGDENIPGEGAYVIAINHISLYEAPLMLAFWPVAPEAAGAVDIWSRPVQAWLAKSYGGIQVHRGEVDHELVERLLAVLRAGRPLLMAPEGGRSHFPGMRRAQPGLAYLIDRAGVPVVPVGVIGTTDDFLKRALKGERPRLEMRIGRPFCLPPVTGKGDERRTARQQNADLIMEHIANLLPAEYRGIYAKEVFPVP
jgi:1-acyl-sn-glycerol-3-phosphate acyltransferase